MADEIEDALGKVRVTGLLEFHGRNVYLDGIQVRPRLRRRGR